MHWIDPNYLPRKDGIVERFLVNPHGEIDGLLLMDGLEVHVPPHLDAELRAAVQPGAAIAVFGVRPHGVEMISAVAIEAGPGRVIADNGPSKKEHGGHKADEAAGHKPEAKTPHPPMDAEGVVRRVLHGPKGEPRGVLLEDGRIVRVPPHDARERGAMMQPGARLAARGPSLTAHGVTVIEAKEVGATMASLQPVQPKPPKDGGKPHEAKPEKGGPHGAKPHDAKPPKLPKHA